MQASVLRTPLAQLSEWPRNYHQGDVGAIIASIETFGFNGVLKVRLGVVIAGNHALKALCILKDRGGNPPANVTLNKAGDWLIPTVSCDHLSETEATAFAIADNRTPTLGTDDLGKLSELLSEIQVDTGLEGTGYSDADLDALLGQMNDGVPISEKAGTAAATPILTFGKIKIPMTEEEAAAFSVRFENWVKLSGTSFGFVGRLLGVPD